MCKVKVKSNGERKCQLLSDFVSSIVITLVVGVESSTKFNKNHYFKNCKSMRKMYTFMDKIGGGGGVGGLLLGRRNGLGEWEGCSNLVGD